MRRLIRILSPAIAIIVSYSIANAEDHFLIIQATDTLGHPIADIGITATGDSSQHITDVSGKARIKLAPETKPNDEITLLIIRSPEKKDLVFISPWNKRVRVPPFENATQHVIEIVLAERGNRILLESGQALIAIASTINATNAPKTINEKTTDEQRKEALAEVSKAFGLKPEDIDKAIRAWGARASDPYEAGLAALYEKNYPKAIEELAKSLEIREKELKQKQDEVADAAAFLGQSFYEQGKYKESAVAFRKAAALRPNDTSIMNNLGLSLAEAGSYEEAEPLLKRALAIRENSRDTDQSDLATSLNNLALLYYKQGKYAAAEPLYKRSLIILEKSLGTDHPVVATSLTNIAFLYLAQSRYVEAEPLYKRALNSREKSLGADHPDVATSLNNLALLYYDQGKYAEAEPLFKRALAMREKLLGLDHPDVATSLNNLAALYDTQGKYAAAEPLYKKALAIDEKALGADHPDVATDLNNLGFLYSNQGKYTEAEPLYKRTLAILEKSFGPDHPNIATTLVSYASLLRRTGRETEAAQMEARAKAIRVRYAQQNQKR